ncbi:MAG: hypothetical protein MR908_10855 [Firmicutes bacterium]|nr:hypothetical protein [Bacillota bacterium]
MFETKRRKNYMTFIYSSIIVVLCLLIAAIAWPTEPAAKQVNKTSPTDDDTVDQRDVSDFEPIEEEPSPDEKNNILNEDATYYLVKSIDGQIKVFFVNEDGEPLELETTDIVYELLSTADQKLFDEGCKVESQEELAVLLQDFES